MKEKLRILFRKMNRAYITHRKCFIKQSQKYGLYAGQPQVLNYVRLHPGCTQNEIASSLGVTPASIAFSTKRMQNAGFLQKQVNSLNMRCNKLYVTPEGLDNLDRFTDSFDELNQAMLRGFTEEELEVLSDFADRVNENLDRFLKEE